MADNQELKEKVSEAIEEFKEQINSQDYSNVSQALYKVNSASDILLYRLNYDIDQFGEKRGHLQGESDLNSEAINKKKAEILVKLQTLTAEITWHILDDYNKMLERTKRRLE